jgi:hypothetical protein
MGVFNPIQFNIRDGDGNHQRKQGNQKSTV